MPGVTCKWYLHISLKYRFNSSLVKSVTHQDGGSLFALHYLKDWLDVWICMSLFICSWKPRDTGHLGGSLPFWLGTSKHERAKKKGRQPTREYIPSFKMQLVVKTKAECNICSENFKVEVTVGLFRTNVMILCFLLTSRWGHWHSFFNPKLRFTL